MITTDDVDKIAAIIQQKSDMALIMEALAMLINLSGECLENPLLYALSCELSRRYEIDEGERQRSAHGKKNESQKTKH
jgi:hypothetical protein